MSLSNSGAPSVALDIAGMHCGNCVAKVAKAITGLPGVEVDSLAIGNAVVRIPADGSVKVDDLLAALSRAGYPAAVRPDSAG